jgi:hypothetical protein
VWVFLRETRLVVVAPLPPVRFLPASGVFFFSHFIAPTQVARTFPVSTVVAVDSALALAASHTWLLGLLDVPNVWVCHNSSAIADRLYRSVGALKLRQCGCGASVRQNRLYAGLSPCISAHVLLARADRFDIQLLGMDAVARLALQPADESDDWLARTLSIGEQRGLVLFGWGGAGVCAFFFLCPRCFARFFSLSSRAACAFPATTTLVPLPNVTTLALALDMYADSSVAVDVDELESAVRSLGV